MRITFFSDIAMLGGGELWVLAIARWLRGRGHHVSIVCPHRSELFRTAVERGLDVFGFNTTAARRSIARSTTSSVITRPMSSTPR